MHESYRTMKKLRQNKTLRLITIGILWIATIGTIPQMDVGMYSHSSHIQKIVPADLIPEISASNINRSTQESAGLSFVIIHDDLLQDHAFVYTVLEHFSSVHAQALVHVLLYTQITSSFL